MLYPIGWLTPELPKPTLYSLDTEPPSALPSTQVTSLRHWQGHVHGPALATHGPRWALGQHHRWQALADSPPIPRSGQSRAFATTAQSTQSNPALMLYQGSQGDAVRVLQTQLQRLGYNPGPLDGHFGPQTERAVRQFQQASHIEVDGVVGVITWRYLAPGQNLASTVDGSPAATSTFATNGLASVFSALDRPLPAHVSLHPMTVPPEASRLPIVGIVVFSLGLAGLVGHLGFRPEAALRPRPSSASISDQPIYTPQPIYPVHPSPSYSTGSNVSNSETSVASPSDSNPSALNPPVPHPSVPNPTIPNLAAPAHLPDFVYDLLQPYGRHQLEVLLQGDSAAAATPQPTPLLAALLQRIGVFPERNYRTGSPYTYLLLDDVGGCFRLCGNELWLTHIVHQWFQPDVAYTAIIRRIDAAGQVLDKEFTVALSRQQWAQVA